MEIIAPVSLPEVAVPPVLRASAAGTYFDRFGGLQTAMPNTPRITYDPADLSKAPYLLLEPAATNLVLQSESTAGWNSAGVALAPAAFFGRDGVAVTKNSALYGDSPNKSCDLGGNYSPGAFAASACFDAATHTGESRRVVLAALVFESGGYSFVNTTFDVDSGAVISQSAYRNGAIINAKSRKVAATVWEFVVVGNFTAPLTGARLDAFTVDENATVRVGLLQLERGVGRTSYIPTAGAAVTRDADVLTASNGFLWSNLAESDATDGPLWNAATAYTAGQIVRRPNHRRYSALKANTNAIPENTSDGTAAATWQDIGPTQRFAVFDQKYSTVAGNAEVLHYLVKPGSISQAIAALGLDGSDVRVSAVDGNSGLLLYRATSNLRIKNCRTIMEYFTKPIARRSDEVFDDLPPFKNAVVLLTVTKPGSVAKLADLVIGRVEYAGEMQWKPEIRTLRRSIIKDDGFGTVTFTKRRSSKLISADVTVHSDKVDETVRVINSYTDQPCVIIGDKRWTALIILGYVKDFRLVLEYEGQAGAIYNAQIEGFA